MRRIIMLAAVLGLIVAGAQTSEAGTLTVDFNLGQGSNLTLNGITNVPGDGGSVSGTVRATLTGVNSLGMVTAPGGGSLSNFGLSFVLNNAVVPGFVTLIGSINVAQIGSATGAFNGAQLALGAGNFVNQLNVFVDCQGLACGAVSGITFPVMQNTMISNATGAFTFNLLNLGGPAQISANLSVMQAGATVALVFAGQEVTRMFDPGVVVPEPVQAGLLGLALIGLAGAGLALRRRQA